MAQGEQSEAGAGGWFSLHQSHVWAQWATFLGMHPKTLLTVSERSVKDLLGWTWGYWGRSVLEGDPFTEFPKVLRFLVVDEEGST